MKRKLKTFLKCEAGTQMLEFAFLLPILMIMFAGIVEIGRMFYTYTTLSKGTEVAARFIASQPITSGNFSSADLASAKNLVVCGKSTTCTSGSEIVRNLSSTNVSITNPGTSVGTRYVTVTVTYVYSPKIWNLSHLMGGSLSLNFTFTPAITMRYVGQ